MGKTLKYVKEFDFSSAGKTVGLCGGGMVKKAAGGAVNKGGATRGLERAAAMSGRTMPATGMLADRSRLGIDDNKNPGITGSRPVAPKTPMLKAYKKGGEVGIPENDMRAPNKGGAMRGLERAAAMSGRTMPTPGSRPDMTALELAALKSGRTMPSTGRPAMKKGGGVKKYAFGGVVPGNVNLPAQAMRPVAPNAPLLPVQANPMAAGRMPMYKKGGAVKKYAAGGPSGMTGLSRAAEMSGRTMPATGKPMKSGGAVPKAGAYKVPKVMTEFKAGELHSGSKTGPVVKSRKQAVAIALSEARAAGKKK